MKRIDAVMQKEKDKMMRAYCPHHKNPNWDMSDGTRIWDELGNTTGCRGITCKECWNKEENNE